MAFLTVMARFRDCGSNKLSLIMVMKFLPRCFQDQGGELAKTIAPIDLECIDQGVPSGRDHKLDEENQWESPLMLFLFV